MIKEATLEDLSQLKCLYLEYNPNFEKLYNLKKILLNKDQTIYIYKENVAVLGFIILEKTFETLSIIHLYVEKNNRHKKIASLLLDYTISNSTEFENIILEVRVDNIVAINLYKKFDFKIINIRRKYYNGTDAYVMERKIQFE